MVAAILAGGLGTRLRPVLCGKPKVLAEVHRRPFVEILLDQMDRLGIKKVVLCTGYLGAQVRGRLAEYSGNVRLQLSEESAPMGTAGALRLALPLFPSESVLVLNGDSYYRGNLNAFIASHRRKRAAASILLSRVINTARFGTVETLRSGLVRRFQEKQQTNTPGFVNAGVYLLQRTVIEEIPAQEQVSLEREIFPRLIGSGLYAFPGQGDFLDIGTPDSYAQASEFLPRP